MRDGAFHGLGKTYDYGPEGTACGRRGHGGLGKRGQGGLGQRGHVVSATVVSVTRLSVGLPVGAQMVEAVWFRGSRDGVQRHGHVSPHASARAQVHGSWRVSTNGGGEARLVSRDDVRA